MKKSANQKLAVSSFLLMAAPAAPQPQSTEATMPFVDVTAASNINYRVGITRPPLIGRNDLGYQVSMMTNGGAASGDCDNDGDIDLFITYGNTSGPDGGGGPNRLYLNQLAEQGNGLLFEDFAEAAGVANSRSDGKGNDRHSGPAFADMDGDGDLDLFLGGIYGDPSKIYENSGGCRFVDVTENSPDIDNMLASHTLSAAFGDYDLDGDLDMFMTHWATPDRLYVVAGSRVRATDHLWRNDSDASGIRFVNVSEESGMSDVIWDTRTFPGTFDFPFSKQEFDFTFSPTFARINDDLWPDVLVSADFGTTQLALNNGDGTFRTLDNRVLREAQFGMGSALGDVDNDGDLDWFVSSIFGPGTNIVMPHGNRLFVNVGSASVFVDETERYGVANGSFGWGSCFLDIDNDADLDLYHTNGFPEPFLTELDAYDVDASRAFVMGDSGVYREQAGVLGLASRAGRDSGRGVVCADFDHDGDTDILELTDAPGNSARLWENRSAAAGNNFLRVKLEGLPPNTEAAGARIYATVGSKRQMREITIGSNYTSQNPTVQIFGLGQAKAVDEILVEWPPPTAEGRRVQLGSRLSGPVSASEPGETLVLRHPELPSR